MGAAPEHLALPPASEQLLTQKGPRFIADEMSKGNSGGGESKALQKLAERDAKHDMAKWDKENLSKHDKEFYGNQSQSQEAAARGSRLHSDKPGHLPEQLRTMYPETEFSFTKPGVKGQDVNVVGGKHPSEYKGSIWPKEINHADFKPNTPGGKKTFRSDQKNKWEQPTLMLPYDPETGTLFP